MAYTTINKSTDYFDTKLYTGNATSRTIAYDFEVDWFWTKMRDGTYPHVSGDAVRGNDKVLRISQTNNEVSPSGTIQFGNANGVTLGTDSSDYGFNKNGNTFVGWGWKANGAGSANTDGSINSTVSANTTSGFSIVAWNGNSGTVGHGLGVKPAMIIVKSRQSSNNWVVMHKGLTGGMDTNVIVLNATGAEGGGGSGMAEPTSSVFTITGGLASNDNNIAYCFAEKTGYSKFGSYTGNGNADGTFVYTGFKPAFVLVKRYSGTEQWQMTDSARDKDVSPNFARLNPDTSSAESTNTTWAKIEKFSNGFKLGGTDTVSNGSGSTYIYMAFAEAPLVGSNNVPCTAR